MRVDHVNLALLALPSADALASIAACSATLRADAMEHKLLRIGNGVGIADATDALIAEVGLLREALARNDLSTIRNLFRPDRRLGQP